MRPTMTFAVIALLALGAAVGLAACGSDNGGGSGDDGDASRTTTTDSTSTEKADKAPGKPAVETIVVRNGKPVGGVQQLEFDAGERVRFTVRSNEADEIHVHGYDVTERLPAGRAVPVSFPAEIEGIFEVELHGSGMQIAELRVNP